MAKKNTGRSAPPPAAPRRRTIKTTTKTKPGASPVEGVTVAAAMTEAADRSSDGAASREPSYDEIARAAYLRFLNRGASDGGDVDDWVEAERELRARR